MIFRILFGIELMLAELIFLFSIKKRSHFVIRYMIVFASVLLFLRMIPEDEFFQINVWKQLMELAIYSGATYLGMLVCFDAKPGAVFSCCVAGYAVQHIAYHISKILEYFVKSNSAIFGQYYNRHVMEFGCCVAIYIIAIFTIGRYAARNQYYLKYNRKCNYVSIAMIFVCVGLTRTVQYFGGQGNVAVSLYAITACVLALTVQFVLYHVIDLEHENETINLLFQEKGRQYELSKKTIETFDIKYHDLKHKIGHMNLPKEEIEALKENIRIYGSVVRTGNEALDVLLTENNLRCSEEGIRITCMGYGEDLCFMNLMDVYSLFGNAIENAVEAVRKVSDSEKKIIDLVIEKVGDMISVNISNYYEGNIEMENDLPVSSKMVEQGFHGFGMKSMRLICEKYGGSLKVTTDEDLFILDIYLLSK